jgi:hypothetical protein
MIPLCYINFIKNINFNFNFVLIKNFMTQRAVLVGINYKGTSNELHGCINDVYRVSDLLKTIYGFSSSNITILTDNESRNSTLYPSKANIVQNFKRVVQQTQPGDILVIHYSGHGMLVRASNSTNLVLQNEDNAIIPIDVLANNYYDASKEVLDDELWSIFSKLPSNTFMFGLFDCCHSESCVDLRYNLQIDRSKPTQFTLNQVENRPETQAAIVALDGCTMQETSLDAADNKGNPAGALTYAFCDYIVHHSHETVHYVDFLQAIRQTMRSNNPGAQQDPQLDFGRLTDASLNFSLNAKSLIKNLSDSERCTAKEILKKIYEVEVKPIPVANKPVTPFRRLPRQYPRLQQYLMASTSAPN